LKSGGKAAPALATRSRHGEQAAIAFTFDRSWIDFPDRRFAVAKGDAKSSPKALF
jgi:hypothetical protein